MLGAELDAAAYLDRMSEELARIDQAAMRVWADLVFESWRDEQFVFVFGNGGSGTSATHMSEDLGKSLLRHEHLRDESKRRLKVMSLTDNLGWILAVGNDCGYEQIFVQQLMNFGRPGDLAIGISGSGNSPNVLAAVDWANRHGLVTLGLTGYDGGRLRKLARHGLHVPINDMGMVESIHLALFHWVLNDVYARINQEGRYAK
ncbi:MAG TPA: SIS domain-containing protein [Pirellulales bacterium]|jgi:D-sedoheptulose 7-phosphate isomerase|nr:SIS domain-containing protein [Pirellulales bacterium]